MQAQPIEAGAAGESGPALLPGAIWDDLNAFSPHHPAESINYNVHISPAYGYVYTVVPKCACSLLRSALLQLERPDLRGRRLDLKILHDRTFSPSLKPTQVSDFRGLLASPDFFKFTFVRDPYDRLLSAYRNRICGDKPQKRPVLQALGRGGEPIEAPVSFDDFVRVVARQSVREMDMHWRVQHHQILHDEIRYDLVGRVETLAEDLRVVSRHIRGNLADFLPAGRLNSTRAASGTDDPYTRESLDLVNAVYDLDFRTFGYRKR